MRGMVKTASGFDGDDDGEGVSDCPECGAEVYLIASRCPRCGHWFIDDERSSMRRSRQTRSELKIVKVAGAILLAVFLIGTAIAVIANS